MRTQYRESVSVATATDEKRLAKGDVEILRLLAEFVNLHPSQLAELTGRWTNKMRARLARLREDGYARSVSPPDDRWAEHAWFLSQRGWDFAHEEGWTEQRIRATDDKSNKNLRHDLEITTLHLTLREEFGDDLKWFQHYHSIHHRWGSGDYEGVNPDAFFVVNDEHGFFLENAKVREFAYREGESNLERKMRGFVEYARGAFQEKWGRENFRVLVFFPTWERAENFRAKVRKIGEGLNTKRFWFGAWEGFDSKKIRLITPRDDHEYTLSEIVGSGTNR